MSIFSDLGFAGGGNMAQTSGFERRPATFTVDRLEQPDGDPLVGLTYMTQFRSEEERGVDDLVEAIAGTSVRSARMPPMAATHIATFRDVPGLIVSTRPLAKSQYVWGEPINGTTGYATMWRLRLHRAQGLPPTADYQEYTMPELRHKAKEAGLTGYSRLNKDDLILRLQQAHTPEDPYTWPGYFHRGTELVLRADDGVTRQVLERLIEGANSGTLGMFVPDRTVGGGLVLYDTADEDQALIDDRTPRGT